MGNMHVCVLEELLFVQNSDLTHFPSFSHMEKLTAIIYKLNDDHFTGQLNLNEWISLLAVNVTNSGYSCIVGNILHIHGDNLCSISNTFVSGITASPHTTANVKTSSLVNEMATTVITSSVHMANESNVTVAKTSVNMATSSTSSSAAPTLIENTKVLSTFVNTTLPAWFLID